MNARQKTALITGASDGVGKEVARRLAIDGFHVVLHGRDRSKTNAVRAEMATKGFTSTEAIVADLSSLADVITMASEALGQVAKLDLLIMILPRLSGHR